MNRVRIMIPRLAICFALCLAICAPAFAQLPPDAVKLDLLKIPEVQKSIDLDPVYLEPSAEDGETWEHEGISYRASRADSKAKFLEDPEAHAAAAARERWDNNFVEAMSIIWCPVTDEVNPGGLEAWDYKGTKFESCCEFCTSSVREEDFIMGLERLMERSAQSYELTGGKYTEGASSPVAGAIVDPFAPVPEDASAHDSTDADDTQAEAPFIPAWLDGAELKPTWTEGVGLVFANRCMDCHRPGGLAPMTFETTSKIKKWSKSLAKSVTSHTMPPWPADPGVAEYSNSRFLTQPEIDAIVEWSKTGYPAGEGEFDLGIDPKAEWTLGTPDRVIELGEYTIPADETAHTREVEIATDFGETRSIAAVEIRPGNDFDTIAVRGGALGAWHAGSWYVKYGTEAAPRVEAGETVTVSVVYKKEAGWESVDPGTRIGVFFADAPVASVVKVLKIENTDFTIPAGEAGVTVTTELTLDEDVTILSLQPIMHQRGKSVTISVETAQGESTTLLRISNWQPDWKMRYELARPFAAPRGSKIVMTNVYDNSKLNVSNPDPDAEVRAGADGEAARAWIEYTAGE